MKNIENKTHKPIKVPLPGGKFLHLGPGKTGQVADSAIDTAPALKKLIEAGELEVHVDGAGPAGGGEPGGSAVHAATHGHVPNTMMRPKGDR